MTTRKLHATLWLWAVVDFLEVQLALAQFGLLSNLTLNSLINEIRSISKEVECAVENGTVELARDGDAVSIADRDYALDKVRVRGAGTRRDDIFSTGKAVREDCDGTDLACIRLVALHVVVSPKEKGWWWKMVYVVVCWQEEGPREKEHKRKLSSA
jgi:hypothetical protein